MKQFVFALALGATSLASAAASAAEQLSLNEISAYLNSFATAKADFTQVNDDGSLSTGTLYLRRPGKVRFEYADNAGLVLAEAGTVAIMDPKSNQPPETYPLSRTPLSIILARNVNLAQANMVVGHGFDGVSTVVRAQDPKAPEHGSIEMMFTDNPVQLRKWVIHGGSGEETTVILGEMQTGLSFPSSLFSISRPKRDR
ncbi:outer membrane lipoprotein carrier protein LolA [Rhodobacteraceae bacterium R_SAG7]|jgi:outer membrane lipoprotein-sorting protein|uniref:LolA family protein n=1 Tax=Rhodobacterales TaxID=204455 RepID=UPI0000462D8C|nr:outer membrane lipoprotein carrier protein LolA [Ruegeria sp. TM1040]ABF62794.1 outer membrane lipoprotein carrier protein LolA [Ruegeria sp. TM1040]MDF9304328.1 outer membrane lipoprotein carrier protein LolA [Tritonibacter mobilis]NKW78016.1 outer membrane lipoprotein carrier protein LolA [Rhodobacteraceae bacterium R_SAG7]